MQHDPPDHPATSVNIVIVVGPMAATTAFVRTDESEAGSLGHFGDADEIGDGWSCAADRRCGVTDIAVSPRCPITDIL